jgi:CheY-like chemotaxis protein
VDDTAEVLEVLEIYLNEAGYDVYKASDGLQAIERLPKYKHDGVRISISLHFSSISNLLTFLASLADLMDSLGVSFAPFPVFVSSELGTFDILLAPLLCMPLNIPSAKTAPPITKTAPKTWIGCSISLKNKTEKVTAERGSK